MEKVTVFKTQDGQLFLSEDEASEHEIINDENFTRDDTFSKSKEAISDFIKVNFYDELSPEFTSGDTAMTFYHEGNYGWDCDSIDDNPIDKCVYSADLWGEECCVFCGQPEERK